MKRLSAAAILLSIHLFLVLRCRKRFFYPDLPFLHVYHTSSRVILLYVVRHRCGSSSSLVFIWACLWLLPVRSAESFNSFTLPMIYDGCRWCIYYFTLSEAHHLENILYFWLSLCLSITISTYFCLHQGQAAWREREETLYINLYIWIFENLKFKSKQAFGKIFKVVSKIKFNWHFWPKEHFFRQNCFFMEPWLIREEFLNSNTTMLQGGWRTALTSLSNPGTWVIYYITWSPGLPSWLTSWSLLHFKHFHKPGALLIERLTETDRRNGCGNINLISPQLVLI